MARPCHFGSAGTARQPVHSLPRYRVVGIRINGNQAICGLGLSILEAHRVRAAIAEANIFRAVKIVDESHPETKRAASRH